jgi:molybdopterin-guanine dinucleotide biosynthesis adapter protein
MKIIAVVGTKDTGKTLLVTKIVRELVNRGFSVGTVKHVYHGLDLEGKDTWKHKEAGASLVVGANQETFFQLNNKLPLDHILEITKNLKKLDFMVIEGFKHSNYAKISVTDFNDEFTLENVDPFKISEVELQSLVDLIEEKSFSMFSQMNCGDCGFEGCNDMARAIIGGEAQEKDCFMKKDKNVQLKFGGNDIPMNPFVQKFVKNTVIGMIKALKTNEDRDMPHKNIELLIRNEDN